MTRKLVPLATAVVLFAVFGTAADEGLPPVEWGDSVVEVIQTPYLCRGPLPVADGVDVHLCTQSVLGREALVSFYFVEGSYACFSVTMTSEAENAELARTEFDSVVRELEAEIGPSSERVIASGDPVVTWVNGQETIRAAVEVSGSNPLIGIVGFADEHHHRIASLLSW